ncbi:MAG: taurine dioxygenase [Betaproteobacteria bacterium]|nr:taurine dioxygenase [Betaproteobacteria bacterium]
MKAKRIAGALGAELREVDLSVPLTQNLLQEVRKAFLEHLVVFFRDQPLTPEQFMSFAGQFGEPVEYPMVKGLEGFPKIIEVKKLEHERVTFGGIWHTDTAYLERPPMASMLLAREVPPAGGDTLFANMYLAYESLSDGLSKMLSSLKAINTSAKADASKTREDRIRTDGATIASFVAEHPVVRTHPETGRKALYVNSGHTVRFAGWTEEESAPLLKYLFDVQTRPEFTCRFVWQPGSIALWDNRCVQHNPVNDYHGYRRVMHRITLAGDVPA